MTDKNVPAIFEGPDRWEKLQQFCSDHQTPLSDWGLKILKDGLEIFAKTIVAEPRYLCKDHRNLHSHFYSKKFKGRASECIRAHFFGCEGVTKPDLLKDVTRLNSDYIGYSVIRPVKQRCLGRTIIDPWKVGKDMDRKCYVLRTCFQSHIPGGHLQVEGYPYMSQDSEATVCAHTALWGVCRYLSERYTVYPETYPYDFIVGTTHSAGRTAPYRGMTYRDYSELLIRFGCHPEILLLQEERSLAARLLGRLAGVLKNEEGVDTQLSATNFQALCSYVESGFPVLASYKGHVVSIVGHTLDTSRNAAVNSEGWIDSSQFLKQFVVVDDNCFPYQLLGYRGDPNNYAAKLYPNDTRCIETLFSAVCPLPEKVYLPSEKARKRCGVVLKSLIDKHRPEVFGNHDDPLVTRLFVTTSSALKRRKLEFGIRNGGVADPLSLDIAELHLPHFVWVMEVSPLKLYRQGVCTAEIVLDTTANTMEDCLLYARVGPNLILNDGADDFETSPLNLTTFPQYTHNLGEQKLNL